MSSNARIDSCFVTDLDVESQSDEFPARLDRQSGASPAVAGVEDEVLPLTEFKCPPPPAVVRRPNYYSFSVRDMTNKRVMSDWEKASILARLQRVEPVDETHFQQCLSNAKARNSNTYIKRVRSRATRAARAAARECEEEYQLKEQHRNEIFYRHKHVAEILGRQKFLKLARAWYEIVVSHTFLTALLQEREMQQALKTFSYLMGPMRRRFLALKRRRAAARELTEKHVSAIPYPYPEVIASMYGTFFTGWPPFLLEELAAKGKPGYLREGSYLMREGDIGRVMFIITTGSVSIILRKKGKDKRRCKENSSGTFRINAPCYVGEFALVCKEPRSASIYCETDIGFWAISPEDYEHVAKRLSPEVADKQREATDARRRQNLKKFFPLKVELLRQLPFFQDFSDKSLTTIIDEVEPIVLHDGDYLFRSGDMDSSAYFFQDGLAVLREDSGEEHNITTGSCIGMFECACCVNERKWNSVVSVNYCDIWRMRRETVINVGMTEPAALLRCRKAAKRTRALEIRKGSSVPSFLRADPYLSFSLPTTALNHFYELCTPTIFLNGERLVLMGQALNCLVVLVNGTVDVTVSTNGNHDVFRVSRLESRGVEADAGTDHPARGFVFGAYEFAASIPQYTYTVTSFGLTEAYPVDKQLLDAALPPALKSILHYHTAGRDLVSRAYKQRRPSLLLNGKSNSFVSMYKAERAVSMDH